MEAILTLAQAERARLFAERGVAVPSSHRMPLPVAELRPTSRSLLAVWAPDLTEIHFELPPRGRYANGLGSAPATRWAAPRLPETAAEWDQLITEFSVAVQAHDNAWREQLTEEVATALETARAGQRPHLRYSVPAYNGLPGMEELRQRCATLEAAREEKERQEKERRKAADEARRAGQEAARKAAEATKAAWVAEHGSDYLKRACAAGYDCQRRYVLERAALEHPDYRVDFNDHAEWRSRACPSEPALAEAERVDGEVVWLTTGLDGTDDDVESCEAVIIEDYLDRYTLVRIMA